MARPEVLTIKCFRQRYGDVSVKDANLPGTSLEEVVRVAKDHLLGHFKSDRYRSGEQPHHADIVGEDDRIIASLQVRPTGRGGEEVVEVPVGSRS